MKLAVLVGLIIGCSAEQPKNEPQRRGEDTEKAEEKPSSSDLSALSASAVQKEPAPLLASSRQMVLGLVDDWDDISVELQRYERGTDGAWVKVGTSWTAVTGHTGSAWGRGLHGDGPPAGQDGPEKREGDGKSPAGAFTIGAAYGYAATPPTGTRVAYTPVDGDWLCIDDGRSKHYNKVLDTSALERDWSSSEDMRRKDELYRWVLFVDHNAGASAGAGSCIFLHVWRDAATGTAGCTAMPEREVKALVSWVDPAARPVYVLLPRDRVGSLGPSWGLP